MDASGFAIGIATGQAISDCSDYGKDATSPAVLILLGVMLVFAVGMYLVYGDWRNS